MGSHRNGYDAFVRDAAVATLVLAVLYGLLSVPVGPLRIPGYLLVVGFDLLEAAIGSAGSGYWVLFAAYLVALGLAGAGLVRGLRRRARRTGLPAWRLGAAGAFAVLGGMALLFALAVVGTGQREPVAIAGLTGLVLLALSALLADLVGVRIG